MNFFTEVGENYKIYMKPQKLSNSQSNPEKEEQTEKYHTY